MQCADLVAYLSEYLDNNLPVELTQAAEEHLATCHNCRVVLDTTRRTVTLVREHGQATIKPVRRAEIFSKLEAAFLNHKNLTE